MTAVLGIDLGTSAVKVSLWSDSRSRLAVERASYGVSIPAPGWAEQDPATWWDAVVRSVRSVLDAATAAGPVAAIGLTGQMHSLVTVDASGSVIRPAILWSDRRAGDVCGRALARMPDLPAITRNPLIPAFTLAHLLWLRENEPAAYDAIAHLLVPKDWLRYRLTGEFATEPSDASGTAMFDVNGVTWSPAILGTFDVPVPWLPRVAASADATAALTAEAAAALGLEAGTPVVAGAGDQIAQAVAMGVLDPGRIGISIGTSGVVVSPVTHPVDGSFCHAVPDRWLRLDSLHSAGASLDWFRDVFGREHTIDELLAEAASVGIDRRTPLFLPFLGGLRADEGVAMPAAFTDFDAGHARGHYVRAVLEGVACELRRMIDRWEVEGSVRREYRLAGGGARSRLWQQILADLLDSPVLPTTRGAADGAAMLAGAAIDWWPLDTEPADDLEGAASAVRPTGAGARYMADVYGAYLNRIEQLRPQMPAITAITALGAA